MSINLVSGSFRRNKLIAAVGLALVIVTMMTSSPVSIYASSTTEDDGWTEGDYDGSPEEQEEQAQEDWEDAGRPGEEEDDDDEDDEDPYAGLPTPEEAGETGVVDCGNGVFVNPREPCPQDEEEPVLVLCPDGQTQVEEDRVEEDCPKTNQASATGLPLCDGTFQDCVTNNGDVCVAGTTVHECECNDDMSDCQNHLSQEQKECYDGIIVVADRPCPPPKDPSPYCNTPAAEDSKSCWDVRDYSQDTKLYPCNDGTHKVDWKDCVDVSSEYKDFCKKNPLVKECYPNPNNRERNNGEKTKVVHETTVIQSATAAATANTNAVDVSNCKLDGSANGIQQKFDTPKYLACGLYADGQKAYSDGFVVGCTQIGNTQLVCQALVDSSILNTKTQPTQTATQPTQAIQPATVGG